MDIITTEKIDRLWWMGRYIERAFSCIKLFMETSDCMIDRDENQYKEFCFKLGIPDIYKDKDDFLYSYLLSGDNPDSINIGKRFWSTDNTDINRMFPGYDLGETTQRIAAGVFNNIQEYEYGIQFASFYIPGKFLPHVKIMQTETMDAEEAKLFALPYVVLRNPRPYDTTTLNYNWQIWNTKAFSLYAKQTNTIDVSDAEYMENSVLTFLNKIGVIDGEERLFGSSVVVNDNVFVSVHAQRGEKLLIPINMRDGALICIGKGNEDWNCSAPHGAGRIYSRGKARAVLDMEEYKREMNGIYTTSVCKETIDESPMAYKRLEDIVDNVKDTVEIIEQIKPVYNFKATE